MQRKANLKNILLSIVIITGLVVGVYYIYNRNTDRNKLNIESVNKIEDIKVRDKKVDNEIDSRYIEDRNNTIAKESKEERDERIERIASNVRGEYRGIRRQPLRYSPIEVYKPPVNNNSPIELPSIPNTPSIPTIPNVYINPIIPNIPIIPNPPVIPPDNGNDTDNPTDPGDNNGGGTNTPILLVGDRDPSFDTGVPVGFDGDVYDVAIQSDGKIVVGGIFTSYQGETVNKIIRLNSDGSKDDSFSIGDGFDYGVNPLAVQSDGKILVGGDFESYQGESANGIIRLNSDGSRDDSFSIGDGFDYEVSTLAVQSDGKILVGGWFESYQGESVNKIIRLNSDGSKDDSFSIGDGFDGWVHTITIQADGKILVGGEFENYQGQPVVSLVRLKN